MRESEEVGVGGVARFRRGLDREVVLLAVVEHLLSAWKLGDELRVAPGGVYIHVRTEHVGGDLEAHLIVAAPGGAVEEDGDVPRLKLLEQCLHRDGPGDARGVPVPAFVAGLRLQHLQAGIGQSLMSRDDEGVDGSAASHPVSDGPDVLLIRLAEIDRAAGHVEPFAREPVGRRAAIESARNGAADQGDVLVLQLAPVHVRCDVLSGECPQKIILCPDSRSRWEVGKSARYCGLASARTPAGSRGVRTSWRIP